MPTRDVRPVVLAIGIDAAEPRLVDGMLAQGRMPALAALRAQGTSGRVTAPADLGSGAVWPTFVTGTSPLEHGFYSDLRWDPATMRLSRASFAHLRPFWRTLAAAGVTSAILDVPFVPPATTPGCSEILDWGAHDWLGGELSAWPADVASLVGRAGRHPFSRHVVSVAGPGDSPGLSRVRADCVEGVRRRGELASALFASVGADLRLVVFTEAHRASHYLWDDARGVGGSGDPGCAGEPGGAVGTVLAEIDQQVGRLVHEAGPEATVFVFSLHGMRAANGLPAILDPLLEHWGHARRGAAGPVRSMSAGGVRARARAFVPRGARAWYHRLAPRATVMRLARPEAVLPSWDWSRTRGFSLPTDQHGWIRLNLSGREAAGIVAPGDYAAVCDDLAARLADLRTVDGHLVVSRVVRTCEGGSGALGHPLPDLVVHWSDALLDTPLRLADPAREFAPAAPHIRGQHGLEGMFILRKKGASHVSVPTSNAGAAPPALDARVLHIAMAGWLGVGPGA